MKIFLGSDRIGFELKNSLIQILLNKNYEVIDIGPFEYKSVHYPEVAREVSRSIIANPFSFGILICSTGIGMSIAANKMKGIRAANCTSNYLGEYARLHNDANILCLGSSVVTLEEAIAIINKFVTTPFEYGKHTKRVEMIDLINN